MEHLQVASTQNFDRYSCLFFVRPPFPWQLLQVLGGMVTRRVRCRRASRTSRASRRKYDVPAKPQGPAGALTLQTRLQALHVAGASQNATMDMCCFAWQGRTLTLQPWTCVVLRGKASHHGHVLFCVARPHTMDMCCFAWQGLSPWTCVVLRGKVTRRARCRRASRT